jgi:uncharacterized membrane-anchored protein YjiN (DUF445 family)
MTLPARSAPPALPVPVSDEERRVQLAKMQRRATGLLVVAAGGFVLTRLFEARYPWLGFVRATAEAAVIGGLADWFAVTALFRHPLGIPIPHTAIIQARKDRLGRTLGNFVQNHFLSRDALSARLGPMRIAERATEWVSRPENSRQIARQIAAAVAKGLEALPDEEMKDLVHEGVRQRLRATPVAPLLSNIVTLLRADNRHQELLGEAIRIAANAVESNREAIRERIKAESPWWVPGIVDEKIYQRILGAIETMLRDIGGDPQHRLRAKFDATLERFVEKLESSPETIARAEALKEQFLADPVVEEFSSGLWRATRGAVVGYATRSEGESAGALERGISTMAASVLANPALLADIDRFVVDVAISAAEQYRHEVAELIAQTVAGWDPDVTARRIELAIGRDLQFIRINGTLVGGLVGLLLYTLSRFWR